jgi:hypothetical protein
MSHAVPLKLAEETGQDSMPLPAQILLLVEDFFQPGTPLTEEQAKAAFSQEDTATRCFNHFTDPASSSDFSLSVWMAFSPSDTLQQVVRRYRQITKRRALRDPILFLAHMPEPVAAEPASADPAAAGASSAAASSPSAAPTSSAVGAALLTQSRIRGKRVQLSSSDHRLTLSALGVSCSGSSVLTVRSRPFPLRFEVDNTDLIDSGVPSKTLDKHSTVVWLEERSTIRQLREAYVRAVRENWNLLGCDRHRYFVAPQLPDELEEDDVGIDSYTPLPTARLPRIAGTSAVSHRTCAPSDALHLTDPRMPEYRTLLSLPLAPGSMLWVRKDATRWLADAVREKKLARVKMLIERGADPHLLDGTGHSVFFYAQQHVVRAQREIEAEEARQKRERIESLQLAAKLGQLTQLGRTPVVTLSTPQVNKAAKLAAEAAEMLNELSTAFAPAPKETEAVAALIKDYEGCLRAGACVRKTTQQWYGPGDEREEEDYAFIHARPGAEGVRVVTNERGKPVGQIDLRRAEGGGWWDKIGNLASTILFNPLDLLPAWARKKVQTEEQKQEDEVKSSEVQLASIPPSSPSAAAAAASTSSRRPESAGRHVGFSGVPPLGLPEDDMASSVYRSPLPLQPPVFNETPVHLHFSLDVLQPDHADPILIEMRSPQFPPPNARRRKVHQLERVKKLRVLITWIDTYQTKYM